MGVAYDIVFPNRGTIPVAGACFGAMSYGYYSFGALRLPVEKPFSFYQKLWENFNQASKIVYYPNVSMSAWSETKDYYKEVRLLIKEIPWLGGVSVKGGSIHVPIKDVPADKVMMTLFLFRNLTSGDYGESYQKLREKGLKPFPAAILGSLWNYRESSFWTPESWVNTHLGEYNFANPQTFGQNSLEALLTKEPEWVQKSIGEQGMYYREREFARKGETFTGLLGNMTRKLTDCLSVEDDIHLFPSAKYSDSTGRSRSGAAFDKLFNQYVALCKKAGYEALV